MHARNLFRGALRLDGVDLLFILFHLLLSGLILIFIPRISPWFFLLGYNTLLILLIFITAERAEKKPGGLWSALHLLYPALFIVPTYKEIYFLVPALRPGLYDQVLIALDRWIFGRDLTAVLAALAHPLLTEILQLAYASFYILPLILLFGLWRQGRREAMDYVIFCVIYGFFLSYLGYFILPAVGPRFSLHDFTAIDTDLPGLLLTGPIRDFVNWGASGASGDAETYLRIQRDVFPSGHTLVTLIVLYATYRLQSPLRILLFPVGALLIFSTLYLRYHYGVDLLGALLFFLFALLTAQPLYNGWQRRRGLPPFRWDRV